jgi:hypothetical protein
VLFTKPEDGWIQWILDLPGIVRAMFADWREGRHERRLDPLQEWDVYRELTPPCLSALNMTRAEGKEYASRLQAEGYSRAVCLHRSSRGEFARLLVSKAWGDMVVTYRPREKTDCDLCKTADACRLPCPYLGAS